MTPCRHWLIKLKLCIVCWSLHFTAEAYTWALVLGPVLEVQVRQVLGLESSVLGLESSGLGLGLERLVLGLGLVGQVLVNITDYKLCLLMHYVHIRHCPDYLRETVSLVADSQTRPGLRSASSLMFRKPRTSTVFGERAFSFAGPAAWNCLPLRIQQISDTTSFKRHLKTFLFSKAFLS